MITRNNIDRLDKIVAHYAMQDFKRKCAIYLKLKQEFPLGIHHVMWMMIAGRWHNSRSGLS